MPPVASYFVAKYQMSSGPYGPIFGVCQAADPWCGLSLLDDDSLPDHLPAPSQSPPCT